MRQSNEGRRVTTSTRSSCAKSCRQSSPTIASNDSVLSDWSRARQIEKSDSRREKERESRGEKSNSTATSGIALATETIQTTTRRTSQCKAREHNRVLLDYSAGPFQSRLSVQRDHLNSTATLVSLPVDCCGWPPIEHVDGGIIVRPH